MSKLLEVDPTPVSRVFKLTTYKGNRIALKLMRLLKDGKIYSVRSCKDEDFVIFEISILSKRTNSEEFKALQNEILSYVPDNFPRNYLFQVGKMRLGFVYSFKLTGGDDNHSWVFHKIKELKKETVLTERQISYN